MPREPISWKRIGIALATILLGIPAALYLLLLILTPVWAHYSAWRSAKDLLETPLSPRVKITPLDSTEHAPATTSAEVEAFGWRVGVPNTSVTSRKDVSGHVLVHFENGSTIVIEDKLFPDRSFLDLLQADGNLTAEEASSPLSYALAAFKSDPEVSFWHSKRSNYRAMLFLTEQSSAFMQPSAIHEISGKQLRGLEAVSSQWGTTHYEFLLADPANHAVRMHLTAAPGQTQADINTLIASIQPPA